MARRPRNIQFLDVRSLTLSEIVSYWMREIRIEIDQLTLERELRRFVLNADLNWLEGERIKPTIPDEDLPPLNTLVDQDWLRMFCGKKEWAYPRFWFPPDPEEVRPQGRPSQKRAIVQEFEDRLERGETEDTISAEARAISDVLRAQGVDGLPEPKTIQGHIRDGFKAWKAERDNL